MARPPLPPVEQYFQYHNRLASFLDWPMDWEISEDKPTPESLARAGFFHHPVPPYEPDNVVCAHCLLYLDNWEPADDPMKEHMEREPRCQFVRTRAAATHGGNAAVQTEQAQAAAHGDVSSMTVALPNKQQEAVAHATGVAAAGPSTRGARGGGRGRATGRGTGRGRGRATTGRATGRGRGGISKRGGRQPRSTV